MCRFSRFTLFCASVLAVSIGLPPRSARAQTTHPPAPSAADSFAGEPFVIQRDESVYSFNADGTGYHETTIAITVQSEAALRNLSVVAVGFASNSEKVEFHYIRVRRPDGSVVETPLSDALEQPQQVTRDAPFYSDLKQEQVPVRSLSVGDTLEWQARIVRKTAEAPGHFWGQENFVTPGDAVVRKAVVELRFPRSKAVTVWTNPKLSVAAGASSAGEHKPTSDTVVGEERVVRWEVSDLQPTTGKIAEAAKEEKKRHRLTPDEELDQEEGALPSVAWTTFPDWASVGAWYRELQGNRVAPDEAIKIRVAEITAGKSTEQEKVQAVYDFVSAHIRYIGVAFGVGRYQPHRAEDVLGNQYGDCKDKETLLAAMLSVLGVHADPVLIGSQIRLNPAVPSPAAFNHLIAQTTLNGKSVWMDPTTEIAPLGMLLVTLRDKQALVIPQTGPAGLQRTAADPPFPSFEEWKAAGTLNAEGIAESHITVRFRGDAELFLRTVVRQVSASQYDELATKMVQSFGYQGTVTHAAFSRPDDTAGPFTMNFDYKRERGGDWEHAHMLPQLSPVILPAVDPADPPLSSLDLQAPRTEHSTSETKLPEGWRVQLPEAIHAKSAWATYDLTYRFADHTLYVDRTLVVLKQKVPLAETDAYKRWYSDAGLATENFVTLLRHASGVAAADPGEKTGAAPASAADLKTLQQSADQEYKRHDIPALTVSIYRMKALSPDGRRVHAWAASLDILRKQFSEALAENRKELELYPDETDRYAAIVYVQRMQRDATGIVSTLHEWSKAEPENPEPLMELASALLAADKSAEAVEAAHQAVTHAPEDTPDGNQSRLLLGQAQFKAGLPDQGKETLEKLLAKSEDPLTLNNAAYELSDHSIDLPLAETSERKALERLTAETQSWTLDESPDTLRAKTSLLAAAWDTMGWILYREGKLGEAESYVAAAWLNNQHNDVRDHLKAIQTARTAAHETVSGAGHVDTGQSDLNLRTLHLGDAHGRDGFAEYLLLLSGSKAVRVEPINNTHLPAGDDLIKTIDFKNYFPDGSQAKLARAAMLNCHNKKCDLIMEP